MFGRQGEKLVFIADVLTETVTYEWRDSVTRYAQVGANVSPTLSNTREEPETLVAVLVVVIVVVVMVVVVVM